MGEKIKMPKEGYIMDKKDVQAAVNTFKEKVNEALQGGNTAGDIQKAVYEMLQDLNIPSPNN